MSFFNGLVNSRLHNADHEQSDKNHDRKSNGDRDAAGKTVV